MSREVVLFICTHNAGRSQLGQGMLERIAGDRYAATSAGTKPSDAVGLEVRQALAEVGVDVGDRVPRALTAELVAAADVVVTMKPGIELPAAPRRLVSWSFPDPESWDLDGVRGLRDAIGAAVGGEFGTRT